jgi:hypothetical protein
MDMGEFITSKVAAMNEERKTEIASDFAVAVLKLCEDVEAIAPERDSNNNAAPQDLPGVLTRRPCSNTKARKTPSYGVHARGHCANEG